MFWVSCLKPGSNESNDYRLMTTLLLNQLGVQSPIFAYFLPGFLFNVLFKKLCKPFS